MPTSINQETRRTRSLSKGLTDLVVELERQPDTVFDVIIVGSGYGGSIAAQQLAGLKNAAGEPLRIAVLERGNEYLPGMFPSAFADLPKHVRFANQSAGKVTGELEGLFDVRMGDDVNALVANGLGGGSLINAGVMLEPDFGSFYSALPNKLINDLQKTGGFLEQAKKILIEEPLNITTQIPLHNQNTIQKHQGYSPNSLRGFPLKFHRLEELSDSAPFEAAEISVAMKDVNANKHSIHLNACVACGDCMTGCNVGAKASLNTNLLAQAQRDGVEIYTGASVLTLKRATEVKGAVFEDVGTSKVWQLEVVHTSLTLRKRQLKNKVKDPQNNDDDVLAKLKARHVILAAGTFGSTEILLRSRSASLAFSNTLGERFSCNGDNIAAIYDLPKGKVTRCTADEFKAIDGRKVGPTITGTIKVPKKSDLELGYLIQEFAVPAPLKRIFEELVTTTKVVNDLPTKDESIHGNQNPLAYDPCAINPKAMKRSLLLGLIGHDEAKGVMRLPLVEESKGVRNDQEGIVQVVWPEARNGQQINSAFNRLKEYSAKAFPAATVISNPMWKFLPDSLDMIVKLERGPVLTVHPLGGCVIGKNTEHGVVNEYGAVFDAAKQPFDEWEGSLLVLDGSIIPGSLGANPSLTISAIALRGIKQFIKSPVSSKNISSKFLVPVPIEKALLSNNHIFSIAKPSADLTPVATEVKVTERLSGKVKLLNQNNAFEDFVVELTLKYEPKKLKDLMSTWGTRRQMVTSGSFLRLFRFSDWDMGKQLRVADEEILDKEAVYKAEVNGFLDFFEREKKSAFAWWQTLWAYLQNRGWRDLFNVVKYWLKNLFERKTSKSSKNVMNMMSNVIHRGSEIRTFKYAIKIASNAKKTFNHFDLQFSKVSIEGVKRLTYNHRANPWQQMLEMRLSKFPHLQFNKDAKLTVDARFLANQGIALAEISAQENQVNALLDMSSFGLFMARVIFNNHILTFRSPDERRKPSIPVRLPGPLNGLPTPEVPAPEITELLVSKFDPINKKPAAKIRLTRYKGRNPALCPVAFIHGYSANGTTFTHPSLSPSIAKYLWGKDKFSKDGRDVWVIDLRSSSGMPTATHAWSYDEIALVDIPAALLHIKTVTGQKVDVVAHCVGAAMLSMAILTRAEDVITDKVQLGVATYLQDEQLGILNAFNGDSRCIAGRATTEPHPTVNAIVMSQKGPLIRYTEANIFRAYVMKFLQRWIVPEGYAFRPLDNPTATEQLIDRLLSTMPYPDDEYDIENPKWPCARTEWVASRHRMDALYARAFNAANMSKETLECVDDFFGPLNMETVMQTIHFVRFNCITNQRGRGEFVSLENLKSRWYGIPTFSIHGGQNGMVDPATRELIQLNFEAAGIHYTSKVYDKHGHQDLFIGQSCGKVFDDIKAFLKDPPKYIGLHTALPVKPVVPVPVLNTWHIETPWIGPRLQNGDIDISGLNNNPDLYIYAMSSPKYDKSKMICVPIYENARVASGYLRCTAITSLVNAESTSQDWHRQPIANLNGNNPGQTWLVLMAYEIDQTFVDPSNDDGVNFAVAPAMSNAHAVLNVVNPNAVNLLDLAIDDWLKRQKTPLDHGLILSKDIERWQKYKPESFNFTLASCQFPPGIMDGKLSENSMQALANLVDKTGKDATDHIDFAIFAGDQIYADATAGLMDPSRSDERLDLPYEVALRSAPMRKIMQTVPVHMLLDDHEIVDNWEPTEPARNPPMGRKEFKKKNRTLVEGLEAFAKYQRLLPVETPFNSARNEKENIADRRFSYAFEHGSTAFYMLDIRSKRSYRAVGKPDDAEMFDDAELVRLCFWLIDNKDKLKFIITPSILLPRKLGALNDGIDYETRSDSWCGYRKNLDLIFDTLTHNNIENTVFLSGDEHLSCHASATLTNNGREVKIVSIHASGLYAPYPFANAQTEDFIQGTDTYSIGDTTCVATATFAPADTRFAKIIVGHVNGNPTVAVEYHGVNGVTDTTENLL